MTQNEKTNFPATYFERDTIIKLDKLATIFAWIILSVHVLQALLAVVVFILQIMRGLLVMNGLTDVLQQILWFVQPAFPGLWYFIGIQATSKALLIFMDIEDNTRRIARK